MKHLVRFLLAAGFAFSPLMASAASSGGAQATDLVKKEPCCTGAGADCLFGDVGRCAAYCPDEHCTCSDGSCVLGFPVPPKCRCK